MPPGCPRDSNGPSGCAAVPDPPVDFRGARELTTAIGRGWRIRKALVAQRRIRKALVAERRIRKALVAERRIRKALVAERRIRKALVAERPPARTAPGGHRSDG